MIGDTAMSEQCVSCGRSPAIIERLSVALGNWWHGAFGRRAAFKEGGNVAFDNAAMMAHDMGHPEIREAINQMRDRWNA